MQHRQVVNELKATPSSASLLFIWILFNNTTLHTTQQYQTISWFVHDVKFNLTYRIYPFTVHNIQILSNCIAMGIYSTGGEEIMIQRGEKIQYTLLEKYIENIAHSSIILSGRIPYRKQYLLISKFVFKFLLKCQIVCSQCI